MAFPQRSMAEEAQHATASLVSQYEAIVPYGEVPIALKLDIEPGWHVYWQNPGDSGLPPKVTWQNLSDHLSIEIMPWPVPTKIMMPPLASYGYENQVLIPFNLHLESGLPGETVHLEAEAEWLICKEVCLTEQQKVSLTLPTAEVGLENPSYASLFNRTMKQLPQVAPEGIRAESNGKWVDIVLPPGVTEASFIPAQEGMINDFAHQLTQHGRLRVELDAISNNKHNYLQGLLLTNMANWKIEPAIETVEALPQFSTPLPSAEIWLALLLALLGGLLLNLMPCVLPVLSLKVLALTKHHHLRDKKRYGRFYTLGVVSAFMVLGGVLLGLRAAGEGLGWGFQLQSPVFVAALILLFVLLTLNLLGVFEVNLRLSQKPANEEEDNSRSSAFLSGVLATVVASPCTVPFMGGAVAYALASGGIASLLVFAALGVGLALPFLLIAYIPRLARLLPKPGGWMLTFKKVLAIPLALTVAWLVWVYLQQVHFTSFWTAAALIALGVAIAGLVRFSNNLLLPTSKRGAYLVLAALLFAGSLYGVSTLPGAQKVAYSQALWQPFSESQVRALNNDGKDVFVAFTAAWCITCKANEYLVLHTPQTERFFAKNNIEPMIADWTNRDEDIAAVLNKFGSQGVPFYVLYTRDGNAHALPVLLTHKVLEEHIEKAQNR